MDDYDGGVECFQKILKVDPKHAEARQMLTKTKKLR